ncbi:MAG: hypothetical protein NT154_37610 [Verrucomicrobia bacterium]|nr:hypothetical protein [Verrucomicrobiota bacterium]
MSIFNRLLCITALAALVAASGARASAQIKSTGASAGDSTLKSLGGELSSKAQMLSTSLAGNTNAQSLINGALQSMLGKKGGDSLAAWEKLSQAKLTPEQTKLAKDMSNLGSAYLVQKNLASLEGSKTEVGRSLKGLLRFEGPTSWPWLPSLRLR